MDVPTAGFLSTCVVTGGGIFYKWISSRPYNKPANGDHNGNGKLPQCPLHVDVVKRLEDGDERMDALLVTSKATTKLALAIAAHLNIPISHLKDELHDVIEGG